MAQAPADVSQRLRQLELDHARLEGRVDATKNSLDRLEAALREHQDSVRDDLREIYDGVKELKAQLAEHRGSRRTLQWAIPVMVSGTAVLAAVSTWAATQFLGGGG